MRARMKPGVRPIVLGGSVLVPEYPMYWEVPASESAAVENLVTDGQAEFEQEIARGAGGMFASPALQVATAAPAPAPSSKFARKAPR